MKTNEGDIVMIYFLSILVTFSHFYINFFVLDMKSIFLHSNLNVSFRYFYFLGYYVFEFFAVAIILYSIRNFYITYILEDNEDKNTEYDFMDLSLSNIQGKINLPKFPWKEFSEDPEKLKVIIGEKHYRKGQPKKDPEYFILDEKGLHVGTIVFGRTGGGKTTGIIKPLLNQLISYMHNDFKRKIGLLTLDVKGDMYHYIQEQAIRFNRENDIKSIKVELSKLDKRRLKVLRKQLELLNNDKYQTKEDYYKLGKRKIKETKTKIDNLANKMKEYEEKFSDSGIDDENEYKEYEELQAELDHLKDQEDVYKIFVEPIPNKNNKNYHYFNSININKHSIENVRKTIKNRIDRIGTLTKYNPLYAPHLTPSSLAGIVKMMIFNYRGSTESHDKFWDNTAEELVKMNISGCRIIKKEGYFTFYDLLYFMTNGDDMYSLLEMHKRALKSIIYGDCIADDIVNTKQNELDDLKKDYEIVRDSYNTTKNILSNTTDNKRYEELVGKMDSLRKTKDQLEYEINNLEEEIEEAVANADTNRDEDGNLYFDEEDRSVVFDNVLEGKELMEHYKSMDKFKQKEMLETINHLSNWFEKEWLVLNGEGQKMQMSIQKNFTTIINFFGDPKMRKIFCPPKEELNFRGFIESIINRGEIVISTIPEDKYTTQSTLVNTFLKLGYQKEVNQRISLSRTDSSINTERNIGFIVDEAHTFVSDNDKEFVAKSREAKSINIYATQSVTLLESKLGKKGTNALLTNLRNIIILNADKKMADFGKNLSGKEKVLKIDKTRNESTRDSKYNVLTNDMTGDDVNVSESTRYHEKYEPVFREDVFYNLQLNQAWILAYKNNKTIPARIVYLIPSYNPVWNDINNKKLDSFFDWWEIENKHILEDQKNLSINQ